MTDRLFAEQGAEIFVGFLVFEKVGAQDNVVVDGLDLAFVLFLVVLDPLDVRDVELPLFDLVLLHHGIDHFVAVDGDRSPLGGQYAGFADFQQCEDQQGGASDHEDHGDGRGAEDAHAADADQLILPLEPISKGVMERGPQVKWGNDDLDVPTFKRRNITIDNGKRGVEQ